MNVTEHKHKSNILEKKNGSSRVMIETMKLEHCVKKLQKLGTYVEGIEEYEQWNLYHADLHGNATAHFKAADTHL